MTEVMALMITREYKRMESPSIEEINRDINIDLFERQFPPLGRGQAQYAEDLTNLKSYGQPLEGALEYRGWYRITSGSDKGKALWVSKWSKFDGPRPSGKHKGTDLFCLDKTDVVAIASGTVEFRPYSSTWGNHIYQYIKIGTVKHIIVYAHLDSSSAFKDPKSVSKGDILGKSGCSGNAGDSDMCSRNYACGGKTVAEDHLHVTLLKLKDDGSVDAKIDPAAKFGWSIKFDSDTSQTVCGKTTQYA